jgi:hypothetical protein
MPSNPSVLSSLSGGSTEWNKFLSRLPTAQTGEGGFLLNKTYLQGIWN